jgi:predicted transcriptional regulator
MGKKSQKRSAKEREQNQILELKKRRLIESEKTGRLTTYQITENGKKGFQVASEYFFRAFGEIFQEQNTAKTARKVM